MPVRYGCCTGVLYRDVIVYPACRSGCDASKVYRRVRSVLQRQCSQKWCKSFFERWTGVGFQHDQLKLISIVLFEKEKTLQNEVGFLSHKAIR